MSAANGDRLDALVRQFRILRGWRVRWDKRGELCAQSAAFPSCRKAWIYPWDPTAAEPEPKDFLFHEVLHCAIKALVSMDKRKLKELRQAEELLVQDICRVAINMPNDKTKAPQ